MTGSTARALATFIVAMLAILAILVGASVGGIAAVDIIRGYASGGAQYAKGHLTAVSALRRFANTGAPEDLARYRRRIHVPSSDRLAREVLEQDDVDIRNSYPFLIGGDNHPADVPGIAWLFRILGTTSVFAPALEAWRQGDAEILRLDALAEQLDRSWAAAPADAGRRAELLEEIDRIDARLVEIEDRFARQLGEAGRGIARLLYAGLGGIGLALAILVVALGYRVQHRLAEAQSAIREREQRFRDVAETAGDWIWETDADLRFTYLSNRVEQAAGQPKERFLGTTRTQTAVVGNTPDWQRHVEDLAQRRPFQGFEYAYRHPDGGIRYFRITGRPFFDAGGRFLGYRGTGTDATREATARREIQARIALQEAVFEAMAQGISVIDADLRIAAFNRRFLELLELPADRVRVGDSFESLVRFNAERGEYGEGDVEAQVQSLVAAARRFEPHALERVRPNGTILEIRGQPLAGGGFVTTYTDVTALRHGARDLHEAKIAAETANHAKSAFLANMSHELRTPLNAVIGFSDLMAEERFGPLGERYAGYARDIRQSGQHLLEVINDILDLARVEAGKVDLAPEPLAPALVVEGCFRMLRQRAAEAGIRLRNEVPAEAPALHADHQRLRQIILNLVGNAIKFSESGTEVTARYVETPRGQGLEIADQGIGMPADRIEAAFEPFSQLHAGFGRRFEGTGLGLPLVRRYMELHGGTVEIASRRGVGTTVTVLFPRPTRTAGSRRRAQGRD